MRIFILLLSFAIACVFINGCDTQKAIEKAVDKNRDSFARSFIDAIVKGDSTALANVEPSLINDTAIAIFNQLHMALRIRQQTSAKVIGLNYHWSSNRKKDNYTINYEYRFSDLFVFFSVSVSEVNKGMYLISGFNCGASSQSYSARSHFNFKGKGVIHYLIFLWIVIVPLFVIFTIITVFKTPVKRKWLWAIGVFMLNFGIIFNWYTGEFISDFKFLLLGTYIEQGIVFAPWNFGVALPIGSLLFWYRRRKILKEQKENEALTSMYNNDSIGNNEGGGL